MTKIDEKKPAINEVSHFCTFTSPNSMPRAMMKKIDTLAIVNDRP